MITQEEIQQARSPAKLREFVASKFAQVKENPDERAKACRRVGLYKMFFDEVMPLADCAEHICDPDDLLIPIYGNQGFDVIITDKAGNEKGRVEIAKPFDGRADADDIKLLKERGYGQFRIREFGDVLSDIFPRIIKTAKLKSLKDYSDATLLLVAVVDSPYPEEIPALEDAAESLCNTLRTIIYKSKRVILAVPHIRKSYIVQD